MGPHSVCFDPELKRPLSGPLVFVQAVRAPFPGRKPHFSCRHFGPFSPCRPVCAARARFLRARHHNLERDDCSFDSAGGRFTGSCIVCVSFLRRCANQWAACVNSNILLFMVIRGIRCCEPPRLQLSVKFRLLVAPVGVWSSDNHFEGSWCGAGSVTD